MREAGNEPRHDEPAIRRRQDGREVADGERHHQGDQQGPPRHAGRERRDQRSTDDDAEFDDEIVLDASTMTPFVTWGTNPGQGAPLGASIPRPEDFEEAGDQLAAQKALDYMGLEAGTPLRDIAVDTVFLGSCTNGRIEDLHAAAEVLRGRKVKPGLRMLVVPGSEAVRRDAEAEGLDQVFIAAGAEWRIPGCSMCIAMNGDFVAPGQLAVSTSNRNFEGRQGKDARTILASPATAAATAAVSVRSTTIGDALPPAATMRSPGRKRTSYTRPGYDRSTTSA